MPIPVKGQLKLGQSLKPMSWERRDRQSPSKQVSVMGSVAEVEEEDPWLNDEHQIAIGIDAVGEVLK
jgi:hypothetical protein